MNKEITKHIIRYVLMILIIITCCKIYNFSEEKGEKSASTSAKVAKVIVETKQKDLTDKQLELEIEKLQPVVRKLAHFSLYMFLGILIVSCALTFKGRYLVKFDISILLSFLYACTDEWHQTFVPGRSGQFNDVAIDTSGAFLGIIVVILIINIVDFVKAKKDKKIKTLLEKNVKSNNKRNVIFIASTGGHLNELMQVKSLFKKFDYHIITEKTKVDESLKKIYGDRIRFLIYGTRKHVIKYIFKFIANCFISLYYFFRFKPEVIVTTGTHTAVPMCYIAKLFGGKIIYIETFANRETATLAGRIIYPIADTFVVQWEEMHKLYPKSVCWGWLY